MKAIVVHQFGGPEVLSYEDLDDPTPATGEVLVDLAVIGVNYSDTQYRSGTYAGTVPLIPGHEGAGVITRLGEGVRDLRVGQRVVFAGQQRRGVYKQLMTLPAVEAIVLPPAMDMKLACAVLNQGRTAHYLTHDAHPIKPGERVLVHAAAGGVGSNLVQMAKRLGAYVYATVSTAEKADFARDLGADEVILYTEVDFEAAIKDATAGNGVDAVFDAIGGDVFAKSMRCLARKGHLVCYGLSAGQPPPLEWPQRGLGSLYLSYHTAPDYNHPGEEANTRAYEVFRWVQEGELKVHVHKEFALADAASAHREIEDRRTIGKLLLIP